MPDLTVEEGGANVPAPPSGMNYGPESDAEKRRRLLKLWHQLDAEYATWRVTHVDIIDYVQPNHGMFWELEQNRGTRKDVKVINNTASDRCRKLGAAMDTAISSEAREWFTESLEDVLAAEDPEVREFLHEDQTALFAFISKIGFYAPNRNALDDCIGPATSLVFIEEDDDRVARVRHVPIGQFRVWVDSSGEDAGCAERYVYTAEQMVREFGEENCSPGVRQAMKQDITQTAKFRVLHVVEKRRDREHGKRDAKNMPWASYWLEVGAGYWSASAMGSTEVTNPLGPIGLLRESGYNEQPFYVYRWNQLGQNAYGTDSPGWVVLGDVKQLQDLEHSSATMLAQIHDPALTVPDALKNASLLPRARNYISGDQKVVVEPTVVIPPQAVEEARFEKKILEERIDAGCYGNILFLLTDSQRAQPQTAEFVRGQKEERLLQLGSAFARISMALRKAIKRMAAIAHRAGLRPTPPESLLRSDAKLRIDFVNPLLAAQKAVGATNLQMLVSFGLAAAQAVQGGFDKLDADEAADTMCDMLGVAPKVLKNDQALAKERAAKAQAANAQAQAASMPQAAAAISDLSNSDPEKMRSMLQTFGPRAQAEGAPLQ